MARRFGRPTRRQQQQLVNSGHRAWGAAFGKPEVAESLCTEVKPARNRKAPGHDGRKLEKAVNDEIYDAARQNVYIKLWRNNRGVAIQGNQRVRYGVGPNGASDWIGYRRMSITSEMVGKAFAQFIAIEAKRPGEEPDDNQRRFIDAVNADGGVAGAATSADEARAIWERW